MENETPVTGSTNEGGTGYLAVSVRTADGAVPLEGAVVTLRHGSDPALGGTEDDSGSAIASFLTDRSGMTPRIFLPAPPRSASQEPGGARPYALYSVEISLKGFFSNSYSDIPVFDGITSVQTVMLVPLPEDGADGGQVPDTVLDFGGDREEVLGDFASAPDGGESTPGEDGTAE